MKGPGVKGVAPEVPPEKGEGDGERLDSSPGTLRGRGIKYGAIIFQWFSRFTPVAPVNIQWHAASELSMYLFRSVDNNSRTKQIK